MANVTNGSMASTAAAPDPLEKTEADWASAAQLSRIADSLDTIIDMIKKDQEESKKRWEKETIGE